MKSLVCFVYAAIVKCKLIIWRFTSNCWNEKDFKIFFFANLNLDYLTQRHEIIDVNLNTGQI